MSEITLNRYMNCLTKQQQEYIVYCMHAYGNMPDFHRGVLPFLKAQSAVNALQIKLERLMEDAAPGLPGEKAIPLVGVKFLRQLISKLSVDLPHKVSADEESVVMPLKDSKLGTHFGKRYKATGFQISLTRWAINCMIHLERVSKDKWRVTTSKALMDRATEFLSHEFFIR